MVSKQDKLNEKTSFAAGLKPLAAQRAKCQVPGNL